MAAPCPKGQGNRCLFLQSADESTSVLKSGHVFPSMSKTPRLALFMPSLLFRTTASQVNSMSFGYVLFVTVRRTAPAGLAMRPQSAESLLVTLSPPHRRRVFRRLGAPSTKLLCWQLSAGLPDRAIRGRSPYSEWTRPTRTTSAPLPLPLPHSIQVSASGRSPYGERTRPTRTASTPLPLPLPHSIQGSATQLI